jgi:hypothetical protein
MTLQDAANIANIAQLGVTLILASGGSILAVQYVRTMRPVWKRFARNVKREVAVISTEKQPMEHESNVLKRVGFFNIKSVSADSRNLDLLKGAVLIVVGYSPNSKLYREVFAYAKTNNLPIIVFARTHRLNPKGKDYKELKSYSFSSLCETELRLVSDVFAVISTFPEDNL